MAAKLQISLLFWRYLAQNRLTIWAIAVILGQLWQVSQGISSRLAGVFKLKWGNLKNFGQNNLANETKRLSCSPKLHFAILIE